MPNIGDGKRDINLDNMNYKNSILHIIAIVLFLSIIPGRYVEYNYEINSYRIRLSYWVFGPRYYIKFETPKGNSILLKGHYPDLSDSHDYSPYYDDFILPTCVSDTLYTFREELVIKNKGFIVELVVPPYWEPDILDKKTLNFNTGTHFGKLFYMENHDYEILNSEYFRITTSGESLYVHTGNRKMKALTPFKMKVKLWGIIPISTGS